METISESSPLLASASSSRNNSFHRQHHHRRPRHNSSGSSSSNNSNSNRQDDLADHDVEYVVNLHDIDGSDPNRFSVNSYRTSSSGNSNSNNSSFFFVFAESLADTLEQVTEQVNETIETVTAAVVDVAQTIEDAAGGVQAALVEEMVEVKDALLTELQDADESQSKFFVMDMNLTRGLSLLPGDVADAAEGTTDNFLQVILPSDAAAAVATTVDSSASQDTTNTAVSEYASDTDFSPLLTGDRKVLYSVDVNDGHETTTTTTTTSDSPDKAAPPLHGRIPVSAYLLLLSAILSLSSIGPLLNVQNDVDSTLKITWRKTCTSIMLLPLAARVFFRYGWPSLTILQWMVLVITSICYAGQTVTYAWSLDYTSVGNATILGNSQAMILLLGKVCMGDRISLSEGMGAILAFVGAILCSRDSADAHPGSDDTTRSGSTLLGDGYAMASSICGVFYITFAKRVRPNLDLSVFMFVVMFLGTIDTLIFLAVTGRYVTLDRNAIHGIFGWMNLSWNRLPIEIMIAVVCNVFGAMGYVRAMHYFSNLVILVAGLCEPVAAELIAVLIGVGVLPGWKGWLGNVLVMIGTISVVYNPPGPAKLKGKVAATTDQV